MAEFNLHVRLDGTQIEDVMELYEQYTDSEDVTVAETDEIESVSDPDVITPNAFLEIEEIETFADIYTDLVDEPAVVNLSLWGPTADRFPIPVQHYALQQISNPKLYEFHALDGQVTLVIAESEMELEQVRNEVPRGALG